MGVISASQARHPAREVSDGVRRDGDDDVEVGSRVGHAAADGAAEPHRTDAVVTLGGGDDPRVEPVVADRQRAQRPSTLAVIAMKP